MPHVIIFADGNTVTYDYDGAGSKISVANKSGTSITKTEYVGNKVYKNRTLSMILTEEGYVTLAGTTPVDAEAIIHSHPTTVQQVGDQIFPQSASVPSGVDKGTFSQYKTNIILGPIGTINNFTKNPNGTLNIPRRSNGAVIYDRNTNPQVDLTRKAIENILKN